MLAGFGLAAFVAGPAQAQSAAEFSCATGALVSSANTNGDVRPVPWILRQAVAPRTDTIPVIAVQAGLRVSMDNHGTGPCPSYRVKPRAFGETLAPLSPPQARLALPAGLAPSGPLLSRGEAGMEASATFTLDKTAMARLKPGARFGFDLLAEGGATLANAPRGASITLSAADIAVIAVK
jgi:hypothetical protein